LHSVKQATGLTLTQSSFVFIIDPIDQANEKQALVVLGELVRINLLEFIDFISTMLNICTNHK